MTTPNLSLPELAASQAQPHVTVNTSFRRLDGIAQLAAISRVSELPPSSPEPADGDRYLIVTGSPLPDFIDYIAQWNDGAWQYLQPQPGWLCWVVDERALYVYETASPDGWSVLASLP
jgi:hypothetical protein